MTRPSTAAKLAAATAAAALVLAACGGDGGDGGGSGEESSTGKQLYFVDGNTKDYGDEFEAGTLEGVKATYPGAELQGDFKKRIDKVDPNLDSYTYGPESYDAVTVSAIAAVAAKSDDPKAIAQEMVGVSKDGTKCGSFKECADLLNNGEDIDYDGVGGPVDFNPTGSPSAATIGIFEFDGKNNISPVDYKTGEVTSNPKPKPGQQIQGSPGQGDGQFVVGTLLPQTGDLAFLEPPETAGVKLAVQEINQNGGVLGSDVRITAADSGDGTPKIAPDEVEKLLSANSDIIVGAASSDVSLSVIDQITGAGVLQISPANTSTEFDTFDDSGLYFRTAPSDVLQGRVLAEQIAADGYTNVGIIARQEAYGTALANNLEKYFTESGGQVVAKVLYDPEAPNFSADVDELASADPDAIAVIGFDETKKIVPELISAGISQNN